MDQASDAEVAQGIAGVLRSFPVIADGKHRSSVPDIWRSQWGVDPLFLGSYSYVSGSTDESAVDALAAPVAGKLFFAGEAMTSRYMGTMHGAYLTGQNAAAALLSALGSH